MNSKAERFVVRPGAVLLAFLISIPLHGQDSGAALFGTVTDVSGKTIPGARITIKNVATGQATETRTDSAGSYDALNLTPGAYELSAAAPGFSTGVTTVSITSGRQTMNLTLRGFPSLEDLGFSLTQAQGNAADQALLDRRSHMLMLHQRYGLIAAVPLVATVLTGALAGGQSTSSGGRNLHAALGLTSAALYSISAYYAIAAPKISGTETRGNIRLHKALAWVHGAGMILTPVLGEMAYEQRKRGEKVHGIASAHGGVGVTTVVAYAIAILTESLK
jgi:Carboxypeptidase regulatory-like domain